MAQDGRKRREQVSDARRLIVVFGCLVCMIAAPVASILFLLDVNESHYQRLPLSFVFETTGLFAVFGLAVWGLSTTFARPGSRK